MVEMEMTGKQVFLHERAVLCIAFYYAKQI